MTDNKAGQNNSWYYIIALVFGVLTAWVITGSIIWGIGGAFLGLLSAGFFVNVLVEKREV